MKTFCEETVSAFLVWRFKFSKIIELRFLANKNHTDWKYKKNGSVLVDNIEDAIFWIKKNNRHRACYYGLNSINENIIYSKNLNHEYMGEAISDTDISHYCFLMIDVDPERTVKDTMTTDEEIQKSEVVALSVKNYFRENEIEYQEVSSGNGWQFLILIPNYEINRKVEIENILNFFDDKFSIANVAKIDTTVFNPSRVARTPGTMNIKGSNQPERPHRLATMKNIKDVKACDILNKITITKDKKIRNEYKSDRQNEKKIDDLVKVFEMAGYYYGQQDDKKFHVKCLNELSHSTANPNHSDTVLFKNEDSRAPYVFCHHNGCKGTDLSISAYLKTFNDAGIDISSVAEAFDLQKAFPISGKFMPNLKLEYNLKGQVKVPKPNKIADHICKHTSPDLRRWFSDLFVWNGSHWHYVDDLNAIFDLIHWVSSGLLSQPTAESVVRTMLGKTEQFKNNPWEQNSYKIAVKNGDLCLEKNGEKWLAKLQSHNRENELVGMINVEYTEGSENQIFTDSITDLLGPVDLKDRKQATSEMFGLMVFPVTPRLFNLVGPPGTGKSTIAKYGWELLSDNTVSGVDPSNFNKFNMESMVGKRANICLDVDYTIPIADANIKKIEDKKPINIDRKFKKAVMAKLPLFHLFCSNQYLTCNDRASGAHDRRWTIIRIDAKKFDNSNQKKNFAESVFQKNPSGVLNFAVKGILDILNNNEKLTIPSSSLIEMKKWLMSSDPIGQFIQEIRADENPTIRLNTMASVKRTDVWNSFCYWYEAAYNRKTLISAHKFYERIHNEFQEIKTDGGDRKLKGLSVRPRG